MPIADGSRKLGAEVVLVKNPKQLDAIDGLIIPGGESGTFLKLLGRRRIRKAQTVCSCEAHLRHLRRRDSLATEVRESETSRAGRSRHSYPPQRLRTSDRQLHPPGPVHSARAGEFAAGNGFHPRPENRACRSGVEVIATEGDAADPVAVRQGIAMAATFPSRNSRTTLAFTAHSSTWFERKRALNAPFVGGQANRCQALLSLRSCENAIPRTRMPAVGVNLANSTAERDHVPGIGGRYD